jgi:hypothetical protein
VKTVCPAVALGRGEIARANDELSSGKTPYLVASCRNSACSSLSLSGIFAARSLALLGIVAARGVDIIDHQVERRSGPGFGRLLGSSDDDIEAHVAAATGGF